MFYFTKNDRQLVYVYDSDLVVTSRAKTWAWSVVTLEADLDHQVQLVCVLRQPLDGHDVRFNLANHPDRPVEDLSDGEGVGQRQAWKAKKNKVLFGHVRKIFSQSVHIKQRYFCRKISSLKPDGQPPVGLLVLVRYLLGLVDELGLKIGMGPLKTRGSVK